MPNKLQSYQIDADALYEYSQKKYETILPIQATPTPCLMRKVASEHAPVGDFCENRELSGPVLSDYDRHVSHDARTRKIAQVLTDPLHKLVRSEGPSKAFILKNGHLVAPHAAFRSVKQALALPQDTNNSAHSLPLLMSNHVKTEYYHFSPAEPDAAIEKATVCPCPRWNAGKQKRQRHGPLSSSRDLTRLKARYRSTAQMRKDLGIISRRRCPLFRPIGRMPTNPCDRNYMSRPYSIGAPVRENSRGDLRLMSEPE